MTDEKKSTPFIGEAMTTEDMLKHFSNPSTLEDMAWALRDWAEVSKWLLDFDAPVTDEYGNWASLKERVVWMVNNVPMDKINES